MARLLVIAAFVATFLCIARGEDGTCGLTGLKPKMPSVTMARCPDATKSACCGDCGDVNLILQAMSADGISIVNQIAPGAGTLLGKTNFHVIYIPVAGMLMFLLITRILMASAV